MTDHPDTHIPESAGAGDVGIPAPLSEDPVLFRYWQLGIKRWGYTEDPKLKGTQPLYTLAQLDEVESAAFVRGREVGLKYANVMAQDDKAPERQPELTDEQIDCIVKMADNFRAENPARAAALRTAIRASLHSSTVIPSGKD